MSYLPALALALNHTGFDNMRLYAINIDKKVDKEWLSRTIKMINTVVGRENYISPLNIDQFEKDKFGFMSMDRMLTYLYKQYEYSPSTCEYIILTNSDNLYSRHLGKHILPHMHAKKDIIAWNFVSKYYLPFSTEVSDGKMEITAQIVDTLTEKCIPVALRRGAVDLGGVSFRLAFLKQHNHHIHYSNGSYNRVSDGYFIETAANLTNTSVILRQTLFIHQ
jgi:hypothetical protein